MSLLPDEARAKRLAAAAALRIAAHKLTLHVQDVTRSVRELAEMLQEASALSLGRPDEAVRLLSKAHTAEYNLTGDCAIVSELTEKLGLAELFEAHEDAHIDEVLGAEPAELAGDGPSAEDGPAFAVTFTLVCLDCDHAHTVESSERPPCPKCGSSSHAVTTNTPNPT